MSHLGHCASFYLDFFLINKLVPSIKVMLFLLEESTSVEMITEVVVCEPE